MIGHPKKKVLDPVQVTLHIRWLGARLADRTVSPPIPSRPPSPSINNSPPVPYRIQSLHFQPAHATASCAPACGRSSPRSFSPPARRRSSLRTPRPGRLPAPPEAHALATRHPRSRLAELVRWTAGAWSEGSCNGQIVRVLLSCCHLGASVDEGTRSTTLGGICLGLLPRER